jgi:hypothetical protein
VGALVSVGVSVAPCGLCMEPHDFMHGTVHVSPLVPCSGCLHHSAGWHITPSTILFESELPNTQTLTFTQQARQHIRYILMLLYNNTCMPILLVHTHLVQI